ncbi:M28 family peptidase [Niabella hibiscisoli]|uniref:M28 family peptidase n=1 Tax=Niabella hibiscisoli TaxID=1825928 RepID=UPI001F0D3263|nr:M28 family peptidase [Niabella hibiscisoli]MCH5716188.1 M28 family peptidase [Niabella hibiscisoli]
MSDTLNLKRNFDLILNTEYPRHYKNVVVLDTVAERIRREFLKYTDRTGMQEYKVEGQVYKNVFASFGPSDGEVIIIGAHYDVCGEQAGADDNASGVVGIMELARLLKNQALQYRIELVAYTLEEPPFFRTEQMGSYVHAKSLFDKKQAVKGMVSLEMIGYYSDIPGSQTYPVGLMKWIYGDKGDYITLARNSFSGSFANQFKKIYFENNSIDAKSFRAPGFVGGIDLSDHRNYWKFGYSALMVTNTAFFRNYNYHQVTDRQETLDLDKMGLTIDGVFRTTINIK